MNSPPTPPAPPKGLIGRLLAWLAKGAEKGAESKDGCAA